jgi:DNA-binding transcriptional LysR family regulator
MIYSAPNRILGVSDQVSDGSLDLTLLRTFLAVYRAGSITAGARTLGLSQPTVTSQIRALEQRSGRQLFERAARGVVATAVADDLASQIAAPLDELALVAGPSPKGASGPVHLGGPAEMMALRVVPALAPLVRRGVRLRFTAGLSDDLLDGLRRGRFDMVISTVRPRGRALIAAALSDEEFVLVAAPTFTGPLEQSPLIAYAEDVPIVRRYWRHVYGRRLTTRPAVVIPDLRGVLAAVVAGAGYSVLPRYLCADELASGALVLLDDPDDPPINTGFLVARAAGRVSGHAAQVRETLLTAGRTW